MGHSDGRWTRAGAARNWHPAPVTISVAGHLLLGFVILSATWKGGIPPQPEQPLEMVFAPTADSAQIPARPEPPPETSPIPDLPPEQAASPRPAPVVLPAPTEAPLHPPMEAPIHPIDRAAPPAPLSKPASRRRPAHPAATPQREAIQTPQPAAPAGPSAATSGGTPALPAVAPPPGPDWALALASWLASHRRYPDAARQRGEEGVVVVRFTLAPDGHVLDVGLVSSSGSAPLDEAALAMLRGAALPAPMVGLTRTVRIRYRLED